MARKTLKTLRRVGLLTATATIVALGPGPMAAAGTVEPPLRFIAASGAVTIERPPGGFVIMDAGTYVVATRDPFEVRAKRVSYADPIVAKQILRRGKPREVTLPAGLVTDFAGFPAFTHVTVTDAAGHTRFDYDETFCPNGNAVRSRPDAPDTSPYPLQCAWLTPFALGSVWGIQAGWGLPTTAPWSSGNAQPLFLEDGVYTAVVAINQPYRDLFGFSAGQWSATVQVTVRTVDPHVHSMKSGNGDGMRRPAGKPTVPNGPRPDLRALPAFAIGIVNSQPGRDHLAFAASVWAAGNSPLVVDGFRRPDQAVMDAYQYFYDTKGNQVGYAPVGTMAWDARDGHNHWHFADFAQYRLLDASMTLAVRSGKEAFCLANTDPVDYTLPHANWHPENTDLHTSCGNGSSLAVRQVLDVGNGDTYLQHLPGQSFDITDLPNGTYHVEIAANPDRRLYEQTTANNVSHRRIILGGVPGARTVDVPPVGLVNA